MKILNLICLTLLMTVSAEVYARDAVLIECGQTNGTAPQNNMNPTGDVTNPGFTIINFSSSLVPQPDYLKWGASCAVAISKLLTAKFKIQESGSIGRTPLRESTGVLSIDEVHQYVILLVK
jgi:hypothetical protein